jgi:hypothetical protein
MRYINKIHDFGFVSVIQKYKNLYYTYYIAAIIEK